MKKSQWYVMSGASFLLALFFGGMANNRKNICSSWAEVLQNSCMGLHSFYVTLGILLLVGSIVFLIFGILEKPLK
ncbi:hypothetical protein J4474_01365 [Candidatus Pacearchaeota archaeon]|nr:hypothetical protein [Candidatus Pacearchaeota archaeon]